MNINVRAHGFSLTAAISSSVYKELGTALKPFARHIMHVDVFLKDINGPKGGEDKVALARLRLVWGEVLTIVSTHVDLYTAIKAVSRRSRRAAKRAAGRQHRAARRHRRHLYDSPDKAAIGSAV